ncbi:TVP38/TMEM64 family protein [Candidatus Soleaferrea massiliensis]|uniref:TVP38/TMEM64 family protein n=1 Tax=Candidatus Soleaferrea massiliensis TaxID=1470354 RepID=UPI00058D45B2|nr:VTT domain-containing protein [Candidatus Soleaferrea massiliensis]
MKRTIKQILIRTLCAAVLLAAILLILYLLIAPTFSVIAELIKTGDQAAAQVYIRSFGWRGILATILLQVLAILSIVIPAPTVPLLAGVTYGWLGGLLVCMVGTFLGNSIVFKLAQRYGQRIVPMLFSEKRIDRVRFLQNERHLTLILFIVYLIPIVPNGIIPYLCARTKITYERFIGVIVCASVPSILSSTFIGNNLAGGNIELAVIVAAVLLVLFLIVMKFSGRIVSLLERLSASGRRS